MNADYSQITQEEERQILWQIIQSEEFDILTLPEVNAELRESLNNDVLSEHESRNGTDSSGDLSDTDFDGILGNIIQQRGQSILSEGDVYSELREHFNNKILDQWESENPAKAYPIDVEVIQEHPASLSISDDDLCASCAFLAYQPGQRSLCRKASDGNSRDDWPADFDEDGYAVSCDSEFRLGANS